MGSAHPKARTLFWVLGSFFLCNALLAEFIGSKLFSLEKTFGLEPLALYLFGQGPLSFNLTAGVLLWPVVFIVTDLVNEYFGSKGVRRLSFTGAALIVYAFGAIYLAIQVVPADFWKTVEVGGKPVDQDLAFRLIFGQGLWIIAGSLVAFLVGQFIDIWVFSKLRKAGGKNAIWLRATGSTLVSQLVDSFIVLFIAFYLSGRFSFSQVMAIGTVNYIYKLTIAVLVTPLIYLVHGMIKRYLGEELSDVLTNEAH